MPIRTVLPIKTINALTKQVQKKTKDVLKTKMQIVTALKTIRTNVRSSQVPPRAAPIQIRMVLRIKTTNALTKEVL